MTDERWICVTAEGEASVAPDVAVVSFAVSGSDKQLATVRDDALRPSKARPVVPKPQRTVFCAVDGTPLDGKPAPVAIGPASPH